MTIGIQPCLAALLEPGERVLWSGRPQYRNFRSEAWAAFVLGLIALSATSAALFILVMLVREAFMNGKFDLLGSLPIVFIPGVMFGYVAWRGVSAPWTAARQMERTLYAVTDRRVIVREGFGYARNDTLPRPRNKLYIFTPEQIRARKGPKARRPTSRSGLGSRGTSRGTRPAHDGGDGHPWSGRLAEGARGDGSDVRTFVRAANIDCAVALTARSVEPPFRKPLERPTDPFDEADRFLVHQLVELWLMDRAAWCKDDSHEPFVA